MRKAVNTYTGIRIYASTPCALTLYEYLILPICVHLRPNRIFLSESNRSPGKGPFMDSLVDFPCLQAVSDNVNISEIFLQGLEQFLIWCESQGQNRGVHLYSSLSPVASVQKPKGIFNFRK